MRVRLIAASLLITLAATGSVTAQHVEAPKIISWSNSKTVGEKTFFQVKPGEKITFTIKADGAEEYQWMVDKALQKKAKADSFTWTAPNKKGMWKILLKTTNKAREDWVKRRAESWNKWLSKQDKGKKSPKEKDRFVQDMTDLYTCPVQAQKEWIVATALTTVKPGQSIQKAIDSLPPEGGIIELAPGVHEIKDELYPPATYTFVYWAKATLYYSIIIKRSNVTIAGTRESIVRHNNNQTSFFYIAGLKPGLENITLTGFTTAIASKRRSPRYTATIWASHIKNLTVSNIHDTSAMKFVQIVTPIKPYSLKCQDVTIKNNVMRGGIGAARTENIRILNNAIHGSYGNVIATDHCLKYMYVIGNRVTADTSANCGILVDKPINCIVGDNFVQGSQKCIRSNNSGTQTIIENNILTGSTWAGIWITCQPAMPESLIRNNLIYGNKKDGIYTSPEFGGRQRYTHIRLANNIICNNGRDGVRTGAEEVSMVVSNNIIANNKDYGINLDVKGPLTLSHNDLWNNAKGDYAGCAAGPGDFSKDPLFADASKADFRLRSKAGRWDPKSKKWIKDNVHSPCIDAGDPKADFSREPAPNGGRVNVGAYGNTEAASKSTDQ